MINDNLISSMPKILRIEPASSCNFHCIHCPTGQDLNPSLGIMNNDTFNKIYEKIKKYRFEVIVLYHGGEPFLNKNFFEMVKKLKPITNKIKTITNGSLLNDLSIEQILDSGIDMMEFSLDGNSPEENDKIRIGGNFKKIAENIKKLIILRNNHNLKKPEIYISNIQIPQDVKQIETITIPYYLQKEFKEVESDVRYNLGYAMAWPGMSITPQPSKLESNYCDHIVSTFTIRWNGDVVPCCFDLVNMMVMGNVLNEEIEDIWNNTKYLNLRNDIKNFHPPELCKNCVILSTKKRVLAKDLFR